MTDLEKMIACYRAQYGDQTEHLFAAMQRPTNKLALPNPFLSPKDAASLRHAGTLESVRGVTFLNLSSEHPPATVNGLMSHYFLDRSSVFSPLLLPLANGHRVLDMCSAPGGKLLVLMSRGITNVSYVANDISSARSFRLKRVLNSFLPPALLAQVAITTKDAVFFGLRQKESFDAILLDVPCSSESHVVNDLGLLKKFRGLSKSLPQRQYSLLCAALLALKPGGHVMYATCSINQNENEGVIKKVLSKKSDMAELVDISCPIGNRSAFGVTILPHQFAAGPAFFSLLRRR